TARNTAVAAANVAAIASNSTGATARLTHVTAATTSPGDFTSAIYANGDTLTIQASTATATGAGNNYAIVNATGTLTIQGTTASFNLTLCPFSYNGGTFQPLNASCQ